MRPDAPAVTSAVKSRFVTQNKNAPSIWVEENPQKPPQVPAIPTDTAIWNFEQRLRAVRKGIAASPTEATETVPARYVGFVGDSYTFLTESHKVPIATELVSGKVRQNQNLPERTVAEIKLGDFVVFPESGDRELVQELADKLIGKSAHDLRKLAHVWKDVLQTSGLSSEYIFAQSCLLNRHRHPVTIRNWLADTTQIGPREKEDLVLIALVTNSNQLDLSIDDVWLAIERLRGAHQRAGKRLRDVLLQRLPQVISQVEERGTQIDLAEFGSAWVVQVDSIASQTEPRGRSEVNRLLREHSSSDLTEFV
jgi:hypothetical protein